MSISTTLAPAEPNALQRAVAAWERGDIDGAWKIVAPILCEKPNDPLALGVGGHIYEKAGNLPVAYHMYRLAAALNPREANAWLDLGRIADSLWRREESEKAYAKALSCNPAPHTRMMIHSNLAALLVSHGRWKDAEVEARKALELEPHSRGARGNLGFAQLAQRNWAEGWVNYHATIGTDWRHKVQFADEPEWDGSPGKTVVLYGEQGLGDEVSFASVLPDAIRDCKAVHLECDPRLAGLFRRSFPAATVHGTRMSRSEATWQESLSIDASLPIGQLGEFYRRSETAFPGTPYLVPCPDRAAMWRALFAGKGKPVIGIAWRGGIEKTGARYRQWTLEQLHPLLGSIDAHWVSLQYRSAAREIDEYRAAHPEVDLREYPFATLTQDYDDTAALVSACDLVICMQTAVAHLGGALGVPTWVAVPRISQWRYGSEGERIPWYGSLRVHRQRSPDWRIDIEALREDVHAHFGRLPGAAAAAA